MRRVFALLSSISFLLARGYSAGEDMHGCYQKQRDAVDRFGQSAPLYYWFPQCLPGGYFQNVQCDAFKGCFCSYIDTGKQIPGELSNYFVRFMRQHCPLMPKVPPMPCTMPPPKYPCKEKSRRFYYNSQSGECEMIDNSCLGFETKEACSSSCVVTKKDKCSFAMEEGRQCSHRNSTIRWHHNGTTGTCDPFVYKGCGGNSNNYLEKWSCLKACEEDTYAHVDEEYEQYRPEQANKSVSRDEICSMAREYGPCKKFVSQWYFDNKQSKCIKFIYGGCFGNENRHKSATGCAAFCNAKIKPSKDDLFEDFITGAISGLLPNDDENKEDDATGRSLGVDPPAGIPDGSNDNNEEIVGESDEIDFFFDIDETTAAMLTTASSNSSPN